MSVARKSGACSPCSLVCYGKACKTTRITKVMRNKNTRGLEEPRYLWQAIRGENQEPTDIKINCNKTLSDRAEKAIGERVDAVFGQKILEWIDSQGLNTDTTDANYRPSCSSAQGDGCATEGGCSVNIEITVCAMFDIDASIPEEECVDDPNAPLDEVTVNIIGDPEVTSKGC